MSETDTLYITLIIIYFKSSMNNNKQFDITVDAKGLRCPMPLLKAKLALKNMTVNQVLHLIAYDPVSQKDLVAYCQQVGYPVEVLSVDNNRYQYRITKTETQKI